MKNKFGISVVWVGALLVATMALVIFLLMPFEQHDFRNAGPTELYYADNISEAHRELIARFNERYRGEIKVVAVNLPFSKFTTNERKEILARALRSKSDRIDVFAVDLIWVPRFARWAYELGPIFADSILNNIHDQALQSCYYNGRLVSSPLYIDVGLLYYRRDLLQQLPDWRRIEQSLRNSMELEDFVRLSERLEESDRPYYLFAGDSFEGMICNFWELLSTETIEAIFQQDSIRLDHPELENALQYLVDFIHKWKLSPPEVTGFDEFKSYIYALNNEALFLRGWPGFHKHYRRYAPDTSLIDQFKIACLPHAPGVSKPAVFGGWNLMISRYSEKAHQASKFLKFALQPDNQKLLYEKGGYIPVCKKVFKDSTYLKTHQELSYYHRLIKRGKHRPYREDYTKISDILSYYFNRSLEGDITVKQALNEAQHRINSNKAFIR